MSNSSSGGQDGISVTILKASFDAIPHVIQHIVNSCLAKSDFPASWKHSMVIPIFKSGDSSNPSNFRPISIIHAIAKLEERLVQRQLFYFLTGPHTPRKRHLLLCPTVSFFGLVRMRPLRSELWSDHFGAMGWRRWVWVGKSGRRPGGRDWLLKVATTGAMPRVWPSSQVDHHCGGRHGDRHMPGGRRPPGLANGGVTEA